MSSFYERNHEKEVIEEEMKTMLNQVFKTLKQSFKFDFARQNFRDCQSCAGAAIGNMSDKRVAAGKPPIVRYAFYHYQDAEDIPSGRVWIAYGDTAREGAAIKAAALVAGLAVVWDGTIDNRPELLHSKAIEQFREGKKRIIREYQDRLDAGTVQEVEKVKAWQQEQRRELASLTLPTYENIQSAIVAAALAGVA